MNAHKFVAQKGIEEAKRVLSGAPDNSECFLHDTYFKKQNPVEWYYWEENQWKFTSYSERFSNLLVSISELKQVVESVDYLNEWYEGKIDDAYDHVERMHGMLKLKPQFPNLHSRIKLVEGHLANYELVESYKQVKCEVLDMVDVSPRCEVRNG